MTTRRGFIGALACVAAASLAGIRPSPVRRMRLPGTRWTFDNRVLSTKAELSKFEEELRRSYQSDPVFMPFQRDAFFGSDIS